MNTTKTTPTPAKRTPHTAKYWAEQIPKLRLLSTLPGVPEKDALDFVVAVQIDTRRNYERILAEREELAEALEGLLYANNVEGGPKQALSNARNLLSRIRGGK